MKPALFHFPYIAAYPAMMALGFFGAWLLARKRAPFFGLARNHLDNLALLLPIAGLFGARLFARLFYAKLPLLQALRVWEGDGLVFYGGFLFGVATVLLYGWIRRVRLVALCDCIAPGVAVGLAFGRIGCFMAGCCWGDVCADASTLQRIHDPSVIARIHTLPAISRANWPLAVRFPSGSDAFQQHVKYDLLPANSTASLPVHPVQLYEALFAAALAFWIYIRSRHGASAGLPSIQLLFGYAAIRFGTEFLRADNKAYAMGLTFSQVLSLEIAAVSFLLLAASRWFAARGTASSTPNALADTAEVAARNG